MINALFCFIGPRYWGVHNSEWSICNRGKYQSPIDIDPQHLVYDPYLSDLHITDSTVCIPYNIVHIQHIYCLHFTNNTVILNPRHLVYDPYLVDLYVI